MYYQEFIILVVQFTSQYLWWIELTNLVLIPSKYRLISLLLEHNVRPLHDHQISYNANPHCCIAGYHLYTGDYMNPLSKG